MKKLVCFDLDGTVYLGNELFPISKQVFKFLDDNKINYIFLTNNSSHSKQEYVKKLTNMGIQCDEENFYTSIDVTIKYLEYHNFKNIFVLGIKDFKKELSKKFNIIEKYAKGVQIDAVIASFDTELIYSELKDACLYIQDGAKFIGTNMDYRCPIEDGYYAPDCGGLCKWITLCTDVEPTFLGKPEPFMIYQVMDKLNVKKEEVIMTGDRFYTDIQAGINAGVDTLAVLSGESTKEDFLSMKIKPTYIEKDIGSLIDIIKRENNIN